MIYDILKNLSIKISFYHLKYYYGRQFLFIIKSHKFCSYISMLLICNSICRSEKSIFMKMRNGRFSCIIAIN